MNLKTRNEMRDLIEKIKTADKAYFEDDSPIMTDKAYDALYKRLLDLEAKEQVVFSNSPTQTVGGNVLPSLRSVQHGTPMLSCKKTKVITELNEFAKRNPVMISWKEDGLTLVLRYRSGELAQIITRGDGMTGEDVTHNAAAFLNIPKHIPYKKDVELRGEGLISWEEFETINKQAGGIYDHPRNLAAGTVRKLDPKEAAKRHLFFKAFELITPVVDTKEQQFEFMEDMGFDVVEHITFRRALPGELSTACKLIPTVNGKTASFYTSDGKPVMGVIGSEIGSALELFDPDIYPYPVDGLVLEYLDWHFGLSLGVTRHHRNSQLAYKWADNVVTTHLTGILRRVTRTGMISLRAQFEPVRIEHSTVEKATLHNLDIFDSLKLGIGDEIEVYKANKIIPAIAENKTRSGTYKLPKTCPVCKGKLVEKQIVNTRMMFCENPACRKVSQFEHFCSKKAANIKGVSESILSQLLINEIVKTPVDLFTELEGKKDEIMKLPRMGEQKYQSMISAVEASREMPLDRFLVCLDIPMLGTTASELIAKHFHGKIEELTQAIEDRFNFTSLSGIGIVLNDNIYNWFNDFDNIAFFNNLRRAIHLTVPTATTGSGALAGKVVVITGTLRNYSRADAEALVLKHGGIFATAVTKKTDYLVIADSAPGATKLNKAAQLGTPTLTESQFLAMIS